MIRGLNKINASPGLGYMMSTYTSHPGGPAQAVMDAAEAAAALMRSGLVVFAPVAYSGEVAKHMARGFLTEGDAKYFNSHELWMPICERFYERCDYGIIATTPGWFESKGIAIELAALTQSGVPIHFYDTDEMHIHNLDEARLKWPQEIEDLLVLAATEAAPAYLPTTLVAQSLTVADIISDAIDMVGRA
jgi:hypothetical protein